MKLTLLVQNIGDGFCGSWYELINDATGIAIAVCAFEVSDAGAEIEVDPDPTQSAPAKVDFVHQVNGLTRRYVRVQRRSITVELLP